MTPNGYSFLVNYPPGGGTFSAQVLIVSAAGAGLTIYLDGAIANSISFPAPGADQNTNYVLTVNVPAGQHTIKLWNQGQDWLNLGNLTLNPYVSILGAYQIGNSNFTALWLWHRTNIYYANATATLAGNFPLAGLSPGSYRGTWWDTFAGRAISNFTFTVSGSNSATISTPPILRSLAFFAAPAPALSLGSIPFFPQVLGTNSPPLKLPVPIANGGAAGSLPLAYSLSITGASPIAYTAINSMQPGGPVFAWKDYSAIGQDISTNFASLTAKTPKDEGIAGPIDIGFAFPFFSGGQSPDIFTQLYVSPNGFVTFGPFAGDTSTNRSLPAVAVPANLIAFFWDDLDLSASGHVYTYTDSLTGSFVIQFQNVRFKGTVLTVTCQLILKSTGEILMQYKSLALADSCTVGVQNATGDQGLQVVFNQAYLQPNFALLIRPFPWLRLDINASQVPNGKTNDVELTLNPGGLAYGTNRATLLIRTDDALQPVVIIPVELDVTPLATWRQTHFAPPPIRVRRPILLILMETDWSTLSSMRSIQILRRAIIRLFSYAIVGQHLTISFTRPSPAPVEITYFFEAANDLSGPWKSGAGFATSIVTDNHDGTETVIVTDSIAVTNSTAHYLRVRN